MRCSLKVFLRLESATHICNPHTELCSPPSSLSSACWPQPLPALGMLSVAGRRGWVDTRLCFPLTSPHWMLFSFLLGGSVGARSESRAEGCGGSPGWGGMNPPALLGSTMLFGAAFGMRVFFPLQHAGNGARSVCAYFTREVPHSCDLLLAPQGAFTFWDSSSVNQPKRRRVWRRGRAEFWAPFLVLSRGAPPPPTPHFQHGRFPHPNSSAAARPWPVSFSPLPPSSQRSRDHSLASTSPPNFSNSLVRSRVTIPGRAHFPPCAGTSPKPRVWV